MLTFSACTPIGPFVFNLYIALYTTHIASKKLYSDKLATQTQKSCCTELECFYCTSAFSISTDKGKFNRICCEPFIVKENRRHFLNFFY